MATITAQKATFSAAEGGRASAEFLISPDLLADAKVSVSATGWGATEGTDFGALSYSFNGVDFFAVVDGMVTIPAGSTMLVLSSEVFADADVEYGESLNFVVSQAPESAGILENSYWVSSVANIADAEVAPPPPPPPAPVLSTITSVNAAQPVVEGAFAIANFKLDKALEGSATVSVSVEGFDATVGQDTSGALQYRVGNSTWADVNGGTIELASGSTKFDLRVKTVNDLKTETAETLQFTVSQVSGNLKDSWYVASQSTVVDQEAVVRTGTVAIETLTGSSAKQDIFDMTVGQSTAAAGSFDTIRTFGTGDVIKLPELINEWSMTSTTANALTGKTGSVNEAAVLKAIQSLDGNYFQSGQGGMLEIAHGANTYLLADTNGNGVFDTGLGEANGDTMLKLIGVSSVNFTCDNIVA